MKRFILIFSAVMFLANSFAVSAWAKPCINMVHAPSPIASTMTMAAYMGDMPCHDEQEKDDNSDQHCGGVCLCVHASINHTPLLNASTDLTIPFSYSNHIAINNDRVTSMVTAPLRRPPKFYS